MLKCEHCKTPVVELKEIAPIVAHRCKKCERVTIFLLEDDAPGLQSILDQYGPGTPEYPLYVVGCKPFDGTISLAPYGKPGTEPLEIEGYMGEDSEP